MKRLIILFVRAHLGLKPYEFFRFANQKSKNNAYYFDHDCLWKIDLDGESPLGVGTYQAHVSLNYLLDDACVIEKLKIKRRDS